MKLARLYDLVRKVAIVRAGPIQGHMIHPYLLRREGRAKPDDCRPELRALLKNTLGEPLSRYRR